MKPRSLLNRRKRRRGGIFNNCVRILIIGGMTFWLIREYNPNYFYSLMEFFSSYEPSSSLIPSITEPDTKPECTIKGNISHNSGRRLDHVPGMEDYQSTSIDPTRGERWFCSEAEARANGWKKAPR